MCNTQLSIFLLGCTFLSAMVNVFHSDLYNGNAFDSLCVWRCFLVYIGTANIYHSFATQSYYRYARVVYASRPRLSSTRVLLKIILIQWTVTVVVMLILPLTGQIEYQIGSQMCNIPFSRYPVIWCMVVFIYLPSYTIIPFVYVRIVIFVKESRIRAAAISTNNARRELNMIKRMILVLFILSISGGPYLIFIILAVIDINAVPPYGTRIICLFVVVTLVFASSIIFMQNTDVRQVLIAYLINRDKRTVQPVAAYVQARDAPKTIFFSRVAPSPRNFPSRASPLSAVLPKTLSAPPGPRHMNPRGRC